MNHGSQSPSPPLNPGHPFFTPVRALRQQPRLDSGRQDQGGLSPREGLSPGQGSPKLEAGRAAGLPLTWDSVGMCDVVLHQHLGHCGVWDLEGLVVWRLELADHLLPIPEGPPARAASRQVSRLGGRGRKEGWGGPGCSPFPCTSFQGTTRPAAAPQPLPMSYVPSTS